MPSSTATPMLDKVRQYAKDWGIKIVGDPGNWTWTSPAGKPYTHDGPGIFCIDWPSRSVVEPIATTKPRGRVAMEGDVSGEPTFSRAAWMPGSMLAEAIAMPMARAVAAILMEAKR